MNTKILVILVILPLLAMPLASSYAMPSDEKMSMKDDLSMKKNAMSKVEKSKHAHSNIANPYFFIIDDTTLKMKKGTVTISGHGAYNPDEDTIFGFGTYSINMGSKVVSGNWKTTNLANGDGNPYGDDSDTSSVHFIAMTASLKDNKYTGNNAKQESVMRGSHQIWISADAAQGQLCVYGSYVGTPSPTDACMETSTVSITK